VTLRSAGTVKLVNLRSRDFLRLLGAAAALGAAPRQSFSN
jgi:hypothetical protein